MLTSNGISSLAGFKDFSSFGIIIFLAVIMKSETNSCHSYNRRVGKINIPKRLR